LGAVLGTMWLLNLANIFCISFLPVFLDTGLQVWNGININSTDFSRTVKSGENSSSDPRASSQVMAQALTMNSSINFPDESTADFTPSLSVRFGEVCPAYHFLCEDKLTCVHYDKLCDQNIDCQQTENTNGGEDEQFQPEDEEEGSGCFPPEEYMPPPPPKASSDNFVEIVISENFTLVVSLETIVSLVLLQLPAICLALYGVFCALQHKAFGDKIVDSLLALTVMFLPFCLIEFFVLLEIEFANKGVQFLLNGMKSGLQAVGDLLCGGCSNRTSARLDLLKFLPSKDPRGRDRALSVEVAKLVFGSCIQLAFQAVLLGGYTSSEQFEVSQGVSIVSSALIITKTSVAIVMYQRSRPKPATEDIEKSLKEKVVAWLQLQAVELRQFVVALPLLLSSLIFQTGTLVLTILVVEWYSAIYIAVVLLVNFILCLLLPFPVVQTTETKLKLQYKFVAGNRLREEQRVRDNRLTRGLFTSWANLFIILRPVENMSYQKISHMCLLQPLRFLINIVTLIALVILTGSPTAGLQPFIQHHGVTLIIAYVVVFAAGLVNLLELVCYFYFGENICLSKRPQQHDEEEMHALNDPVTTATTDKVEEEKPSENEQEPLLNKSQNNDYENTTISQDIQAAKEGDQEEQEANTEVAESNEHVVPLLDESANQNNSYENTTVEEDIEAAKSEQHEQESEDEKTDNYQEINEKPESERDESRSESEKEEEDKPESDKDDEEKPESDKDSGKDTSSNSSTEDLTTTDNEAEPEDSPARLLASATDPTPLSAVPPRLTTQVSVRADFFVEDQDLDSTLTLEEKEEVKQAINDIQQQGDKIDKEKFISTMMAIFPTYKIESNKLKLGRLFDRLADNDLISFRQFMLTFYAFSSIPLQDKLVKIFKLIDMNNDDELTYDEFEDIVKDIMVLKEERKMSNTLAEQRFTRNTFADLGMDSEGKVNLTNFVDACTNTKFIFINYVENFRDDFLVKK